MSAGLTLADSRLDRRRRLSRLRLVMIGFAVAYASIGLRLIDMIMPVEEPIAALGVQTVSAELPEVEERASPPDPRRAEIVDSRGALLATNIVTLSVAADPSKIAHREHAASSLAGVLDGADKAELLARFERGGRFAYVKRHISPREQMAIQDLGIPGVFFVPSEKRVYPNGRLAAHVLGFVDIDNQGLAGIEYGQQAQLVGGVAVGKDALALAIDSRVQAATQSALGNAVTMFGAKGGCALVLSVETREVVALSSLPDFDPNHPELSPSDARLNRCVGGVYELGSMFKIITTAMALESGQVDLYDRFDATKPLQIGRHRIRDDHAKNRWLTVPEIFAFSSNIGTARMATAAGGAEAQKQILQELGLFDRPALDVPGARDPLLPRRWIDIVSATVSYGHGIAVSPLQFAESVAALIDDGRFERASFLPRLSPADGRSQPIVSDQTIRTLRWLMWLATEHGTSTQAKAPGYLVGGKTGTAEKPSGSRAGYEEDAVISSFIGAFPINDPRYIVMVSLDEPHGTDATYGYRYAGWTAAPVVSRIIAAAGPLLGVDRTDPGAAKAMNARLRIMPTVNGRTFQREDGFEAIRPAG